MNILIAPDSFKGSLSAVDFCAIVAQQIRFHYPDVHLHSIPMADGGEGTIDAVLAHSRGRRVDLVVHDALDRIIEAQYAILDDRQTAIIEIAQATGLPLIEFKQRNPMLASSYGSGELILHALNQGCRRFIIALGGSASNDGGTGMLQALGVRFLDAQKNELSACGQMLTEIDVIDLTGFEQRLNDCDIIIAADVINPLLGDNGATHTFARQKGAGQHSLVQLEAGMKNFADKSEDILAADHKKHLLPGAGAAGGMGFALMAYCQASMQSGFQTIAGMSGLDHYFNALDSKSDKNKPDLIITGEGCFDRQSLSGKHVGWMIERAKQYNIPLIIICGIIGKDINMKELSQHMRIYSLCQDGMSIAESMAKSAILLTEIINNIVQDLIRK